MLSSISIHSTDQPRATDTVYIDGQTLTLEQIVRVARFGAPVAIVDDPQLIDRIEASCEYIKTAVAQNQPIYGVTTGFGGMANVIIAPEEAADLQNNAVWYHKTGAGKLLPNEAVRAAMLLRANSHMRGVSGIRLEFIRRMVIFLNQHVTPHIRELGSIGASGDLVPLTSITGALMGMDASFKVDFAGETLDSITALERLNLPRLLLLPKEALAMMNGTSVMTGIGANCVYDASTLLALALNVHALFIQGLRGTNQSFHEFIHRNKPHPGQVWAAGRMRELLAGSQLSLNELDGKHDYRKNDLIQDRYSLRCLPQYLGPIFEGLGTIARQIQIEANSASDNPLIDSESGVSYHGGNFLGEYIGVGMDQLRYYLGLVAKHIDVQIALLVTPQFNNGLAPSLVGNRERRVNMGLKGLQITANSIMPLLLFYGNSLADRFPTHAEQYNQNINSQGFGSANLTRQSLELFHQYIAIALIFAVQAVDLRAFAVHGDYDARCYLSPQTRPLYEAVRAVVGCSPSAERPYIWNDDEQDLELHINQLADDIIGNGLVPQSIASTHAALGTIVPLTTI
ncbi:MAG: aromatic amino acid lyase [Herpetosiphonaceae bacterium]|nr:aromatic amino acid lyase [Herpetosiphonaceae bacterium]